MQLHHIGIAVPEIAAGAQEYASRFGYVCASPVFEDPVQAARVQFWQLPGADHYLEFVSPLDEKSPLNNAIAKGRRLNHLCYLAPEIEDTCARLRKEGMFLLQAPVEAVAFRPRRIAWLLGQDGIPIELVEPGSDDWVPPGE